MILRNVSLLFPLPHAVFRVFSRERASARGEESDRKARVGKEAYAALTGADTCILLPKTLCREEPVAELGG